MPERTTERRRPTWPPWQEMLDAIDERVGFFHEDELRRFAEYAEPARRKLAEASGKPPMKNGG